MGYMSSKEAASRWGISERRVRILCSEGRVDGAVRSGWSWNIPDTLDKPADGRLLRHLKNFSLRSGSYSFSRLEELKKRWISLDAYQERTFLSNPLELGLLVHFLLSCDGVDVPVASVISILKGTLVPSVSLDLHLLVINIRENLIFLETLMTDREAEENGIWSESRLVDFYAHLVHGLSGIQKPVRYRDARIKSSNAFGNDTREYTVETQMKSLFFQYEKDWPQLHPFVRAAFVGGELLRIQPFGQHSALCAWLVLTGEFLCAGYPPPVIAQDKTEELGAALAMTARRGNYQHLIRLLEDAVEFRVQEEE